jgi:hypothetical protein
MIKNAIQTANEQVIWWLHLFLLADGAGTLPLPSCSGGNWSSWLITVVISHAVPVIKQMLHQITQKYQMHIIGSVYALAAPWLSNIQGLARLWRGGPTAVSPEESHCPLQLFGLSRQLFGRGRKLFGRSGIQLDHLVELLDCPTDLL